MRIAHILGLGQSGVAAARLLNRDGWHVSASDAGHSEALLDRQHLLEAEGISVALGLKFDLDALAARGLAQPERIVVSPGVSWQLPALEVARSQGIETLGEMELAWRYLQNCPWVGITGTNGKTTTTAMIAAMFQAAGLQAPACGNIGYSACELALAGKPLDWVIAEISSYQIESSSTLAPRIGVWTTFTPDHLERHRTIERYREIKATLLHRSQYRVLNGDDVNLRNGLLHRWPDAWRTSLQDRSGEPLGQGGTPQTSAGGNPVVYVVDGWVQVKGEPILPVNSLRMPGPHNQQNLLLSVAVARLAGLETGAIAHAVANFPGVPHRLEYICTWQGVDFVNDSKATNYDAAQTGLAAVSAPTLLIAGGQSKAGDDTTWMRTIQAKAAAVLLIGEAASTFAKRLDQLGYKNYEIVETLERAVSRAADLVRQSPVKSVLLSPACASFDQYQNFEHRGEHFRQLCQHL